MENTKHYPTHPGAEHPPIMTCEIPLEEYESLKRENERLTIDKRNAELRADVADAAIAELKAKLESVQASAYAESVDAGIENRKLKRAMWLARAERAKAIKWHEGLERYLQERKKYWPSRFSFMKDDEMYHLWYKCWCKVERKCRAKAKEYE